VSEGFRIATAYVQVSPDTDGFKDELKAKVDEATAGVEAKVRVGLDTGELDAKVDEVNAKLDELDGREVRPKVGLDTGDFDAKSDDAKAKLDDLDGKEARARLDLDDDDFKTKADDADSKLDDLDGREAQPRLDLDDTDFNAKADEAEARLDELEAQSATLNLGGSGGGGGGGGESGGFGLPGGFMTGIGGLLAGLSPGIGGAATGLGLLGATGALAFGGIGKAVSAAHQASLNLGMTSQQMAATQFANSVQVQQANEAIGESQMNLASVERNAAASQVQALQSVTQAQQGVEQANYGLTEAQYQLTQAWVQAREQIVQLNDQLADSKLNVAQAQLAVQQAEYQQTLTDQNAYSTSLDRQQAALAVAQAQQQVKDATDQQTAAQYAADLANKQGVAGSQTVIQAKQAVTQAQYQQTDAVKQYQMAQANLVLTEKNNAAQIKQAQLQVTYAEQNLTNTIKEQQLQWAATMSTQNQAARQFAADMARLTPAGRAFVDQILAMKGAFKQLEAVAQNTILPGFTVFLHGIQYLMPTITAGVGKMGAAISNAFGQFGKMMQTPAFAKTLQGLIANGVQFANTVLPAFAGFIQELAKAGAQNGAVSGLANLLAGLGVGLTNIVKAIEPFEGALSSVFSTLGAALRPVGTLIGTVVGSLASALAPALHALLPGFNALVSALGKGLSVALQAVGPLLVPVAQAISAVVTALAPLLPQFGQLIAQFARGLTPVLSAVVPLVGQLAQLLVADQQGLLQVFTALMPLLPPLAKLIISLTPLIGLVLKFTTYLLDMAVKIEGPVISAIVKVLAAVLDLAANWKTAFDGIAKVSDWLWHEVLDPMWQGIEKGASAAVSALATIWDRLEGVFKNPVNFLIRTVYDDGIARLWNDVVGAVGLGSVKLPVIPALARGGVVPGNSPGRDNHLAAVSGGEGILTPQATTAIGGRGTVDALNKQYPSNSGAPKSHDLFTKELGHQARRRGAQKPLMHAATAGMFAGGGIVGGIGSFLSGAAHAVGSVVSGALDVGKMIAAVATGNTAAFVNAAAGVIGTPAAGDLAKIMIGMPKTLVSDLASKLKGAVGMSTPGPVSGTAAQWFAQAVQLAGVPASWIPDLETIAQHESSMNPSAINLTDCITLDYVILTRRGWLTWDEVQVGDETIGYNPETGRSEWTRITRVVRYEDAEVWRIGNKHWHVDVTPNHRWWSDTLTRIQPAFETCPECGWVPRGSKNPARGVQVHRNKIHGVDRARGPLNNLRGEFVRTDGLHAAHRLRLAAPAVTDGIPGLSLEEVRVLAWLQGDGSITPALVKPRSCPECGWIPGDYRGRTGDQPANAVAVHRAKKHGMRKDQTAGEPGGYDGRIWQSKPEQIVKLRALLARVPHTETLRPHRGKAHHLPSYVFTLRREFTTDLVKRSGLMETGPEAFVLALSPEQRAAWLDSMIDAEGHRQPVAAADRRRGGSGEFVRIAQVNGPLQDAIKLAVFLEGYRPTFSPLSAEQHGYQPSGHVGMARPHVAPSTFAPHKVLERQPVWCVTTGLGTWTARGGDGLPFLTGNSNAAAGDPSRGLLAHAGDHVDVPGVPRARDQHEHLRPDR
jgi:phage-related protein